MKHAEGTFSGTTLEDDSGRLFDAEGRQIFYTDGAVDRNGRPDAVGGCAYYSGDNCKSSWEVPYEVAPDGRRYHIVTNQNSELLAILGAFQRAYWDGATKIVIRTDSKWKDIICNFCFVWQIHVLSAYIPE